MDEFDQILLVTDQGQLIRTPVKQVRMVGRNTSGVIIFRTSEQEHVVSVERLADTGEDEVDDEAPEIDGDAETRRRHRRGRATPLSRVRTDRLVAISAKGRSGSKTRRG